MRSIRLERAAWSAALTGALALGLAACGDDSGNPSPTTGSGTFTTTGTGATSGGGGEGGGTGDGGGGGTGEGGGCTGEDGCFACEPTENVHFLEACTDSQCAPFDNEERLPLYDGGDLPPVP